MYCKLCFLFNTNCKRLQTTIRICIWLVLQCRHADFFGLLAIVCSSWVPINIATSKRSVALPEGNTALSYVANANCMCSRFLGLQFCVRSVDWHFVYSRSQGHSFTCTMFFNFLCTCVVHKYFSGGVLLTIVFMICTWFSQHLSTVLICALICARGGTFFLEQPGGSYMEYFDKLQWLYERVPVSWHHNVKRSHGSVYSAPFCIERMSWSHPRWKHRCTRIYVSFASQLAKQPRCSKWHGGWAIMAMCRQSDIRHLRTTSGQPSLT